jgi:hypothetical protein
MNGTIQLLPSTRQQIDLSDTGRGVQKSHMTGENFSHWILCGIIFFS